MDHSHINCFTYCFCRTRGIPDTLVLPITKKNLKCDNKVIRSLEHVQMNIDLEYTNRAILFINVKSHSGTSSKFLYSRSYDAITQHTTYKNLYITSVHFWGESLLGNWTVKIKEESKWQSSRNSGKCLVYVTLYSF